MKFYFFFFVFALFTNCSSNYKNKDIDLTIVDANLSKKTITIQLLNKSDQTYFLAIDTTRFNEYLSYNYDFNHSIHFDINLYNDDKLLHPKSQINIEKSENIDLGTSSCFKKDREKADLFYKNFKKLNNIIVLKPNIKKVIKMPLLLNYSICNGNYYYELEQTKDYYIQLKYRMDKKIVDSVATKNIYEKLVRNNILPYYEEINSNKLKLK